MSQNIFGFKVLTEAIKYSQQQDEQAEIIVENIVGIGESLGDDVKDEFYDDSVEGDMEGELDSGDDKLYSILELIPEDGEEEGDFDDLNDILEGYIATELDGGDNQ